MKRKLLYVCIIAFLFLLAFFFTYKKTTSINAQSEKSEARNNGTSLRLSRECFVCNYSNVVLVFDADSVGNMPPLRQITGFKEPAGLVLDTETDELYIVDMLNNAITVYDRATNGDTAPRRSIRGPQTNLYRPEDVALNIAAGEIYVANHVGKSITVYPSSAKGDVLPIRTIRGGDTQLIGPSRITYDAKRQEILVINHDYQRQRYNALAFDRTANGNIKPKRVILETEVTANGEIQPKGIAVDSDSGSIMVLNTAAEMPDYGESYIEIYDTTQNGPRKALVLQHQHYDDFAFDSASREVYLIDSLANTISVYQLDEPAQKGPIRTITGSATGLSNPTRIIIHKQRSKRD